MSDNIVSLNGVPVDFGDPVREDFIAFAAQSYDRFKAGCGQPTAFVLSVMNDDGTYKTYWLGAHSAMPSSAFLGIAISGIVTGLAQDAVPYEKDDSEED